MATPPANQSSSSVIEVDGITIDLKNRALAAFLAWLVPGAGHWYQGRQTKAILFFVAILLTYFIGFAIGEGHVVYASWVPGDKRWHYICQLGAGAVTLPALIQTNRLNKYTDYSQIPAGITDPEFEPWVGGWMSPPRRPVVEDRPDDTAAWYARMGSGYEMGTWYTMIAGLLNILVIYDAYAGPLSTPISGRRQEEEDEAAEESEAAT